MLFDDGDEDIYLMIAVSPDGIEVTAEAQEGKGKALGGKFTWQEIAEELFTQAKELGREEAVQMGV